jgi:hypothetical protein
MDTLAHKALERGQATPACTCYDCTAALGVVAAAEAAEAVKALAGTRADYRNLPHRHRLALSLHERCPEA